MENEDKWYHYIPLALLLTIIVVVIVLGAIDMFVKWVLPLF